MSAHCVDINQGVTLRCDIDVDAPADTSVVVGVKRNRLHVPLQQIVAIVLVWSMRVLLETEVNNICSEKSLHLKLDGQLAILNVYLIKSILP